MKTKRLGLTIFFIVLTLSIGLVSINLPLSTGAQNSALSQIGNGDAEQEIGQSQSSEQNSQVVSGDSGILSGNNLNCQNQENYNIKQMLEFCNTGTENLPNIEALGLNLKPIGLNVQFTLYENNIPIRPGVIFSGETERFLFLSDTNSYHVTGKSISPLNPDEHVGVGVEQVISGGGQISCSSSGTSFECQIFQGSQPGALGVFNVDIFRVRG